jgi:uncharacterized protein (TIGR03066 family)
MKRMSLRIATPLCLVFLSLLFLSTRGSSGEVKAALLVGTWEFVEVPANHPKEGTLEFTKDGKIKATFKMGDKTINKEAKYKVEGNKLSIIDGERQETATIKSLTKNELVVQNPKGETIKLKRKSSKENK